MGKNLIPEVAELLGVEIGERFKVVGEDHAVDAIITDESFCEITRGGFQSPNSMLLHLVLKGEWELQKLPWEPKYKEEYFCPNIRQKTVAIEQWTDETFDYAMKGLGMVYRTREEAEAHFAEDYERLTGKPLDSH